MKIKAIAPRTYMKLVIHRSRRLRSRPRSVLLTPVYLASDSRPAKDGPTRQHQASAEANLGEPYVR